MRNLLFLIPFIFMGCSDTDQKSVTIYVSEDQVFSQPLLKDFEKETGVRVDAIYDTEESKSTGVMNRLIAQKSNPQADVYWANEPIRAEVLRQKGILSPYQSPNAKGIPSIFQEKNHYWTGFSARIRVLVVNKSIKDEPTSILDYTNPKFKGESVIANPLFGTTTAHISALFSVWGKEKTEKFLKQLKENKTAISTGNGESADFVADNSYAFSLVDSDDAISRLRQGREIKIVYPDQKDGEVGVFVVPNAVMMIRNAPHPKMAKKLIDYLLSKKSEEKLAFADCAQIPLHHGVAMPKELKPIDQIKVMKVDYARVAKEMMEIQEYLKRFL
ncbi:MAG: iron ABC transporter substrate-binding protein [Epsilonproteobacteria bacterium]|nr:MAG: iron ABC transporter substrate-binding protein [Campylobacterota bacterium]